MARDQAKSWLYELSAYHLGEQQRLQRAASAKGYGLNPVEFSRPYPSTSSSSTTNLTALQDTTPTPTPTTPTKTDTPVVDTTKPTDKKTNLPGWASALLVGAGVIGGGAGVVVLKPSAPIANVVPNQPSLVVPTGPLPFVWDEVEQVQVMENGKLVWKPTGKTVRKRLNLDKTEEIFDPISGTWKKAIS